VDRFDGARIYFSPCGIGLGHVGRCHPVAEELMRRGAEVFFSTYLEGVDYLRRHGLPFAASPAISMVNDATGSIDLKMSSIRNGIPAAPTFWRQVVWELGCVKAFSPDLVVSDSRLSSIFAAKLLGVPVVLILNQFQPIIPRSEDRFMLTRLGNGIILTFIGKGWAMSDAILIPDFPEPYTISLDSLRIPGHCRERVRLVGSILSKKPGDVGGARRVRKEVGVGDGQRLIFAAISGPRPERMPLLSMLEPIFAGFPEEYRVLMSMGMPGIRSDPVSKGPLTMVPWVPDRFGYLKACDLVVSRGGHETIMQSICYGKPSIIIPVPKHSEQYGNARRAMELGVAEALHQCDLSREKLLDLIGGMLGNGRYEERLQEMNERNHLGDGVENTVSAIGEFLPR